GLETSADNTVVIKANKPPDVPDAQWQVSPSPSTSHEPTASSQSPFRPSDIAGGSSRPTAELTYPTHMHRSGSYSTARNPAMSLENIMGPGGSSPR
ncbi:hypothetical protein GGF44_003994, partial [Coemansia sp. RSA 1694]